MNGLNLIGKARIDGQEVELTKLVIYDLKRSQKQDITRLLEERITLEDSCVIDM